MKANIISIFIALFIFASNNAKAQDTMYMIEFSVLTKNRSEAQQYFILSDKNLERPQQKLKIYDRLTHNFIATADLKSLEPLQNHGYFTKYDSSGNISLYGKYHKNEMDSSWSRFENNNLVEIKEYDKGVLKKATYYHPNGQEKRKEIYKKEILVEGKCYDMEGKEIPYYPAYIKAVYDNDKNGLAKYIAKNLRYPVIDVEMGNSGVVIVEFFIEEDGTITNVKALNKVGIELSKEAERLIKSASKWTPGTEEGKIVRQRLTQLIYFSM